MRSKLFIATPLLALTIALAACRTDDAPGATLSSVAEQATGLEAVEAAAAQQTEATGNPVLAVYKTPTCGCCGAWVDHVEAHGFETEVLDLNDLSAVKARHGITRDIVSCHTTIVGGYFVEGHVPADVIARLLRERPDIRGIAVPGMPIGSPGMEGPFTERYDILAIGHDGTRTVYETR